jgi:hypothetical protein
MTRLAPVGGDRWAGTEGIHQQRFHLAYGADTYVEPRQTAKQLSFQLIDL